MAGATWLDAIVLATVVKTTRQGTCNHSACELTLMKAQIDLETLLYQDTQHLVPQLNSGRQMFKSTYIDPSSQ